MMKKRRFHREIAVIMAFAAAVGTFPQSALASGRIAAAETVSSETGLLQTEDAAIGGTVLTGSDAVAGYDGNTDAGLNTEAGTSLASTSDGVTAGGENADGEATDGASLAGTGTGAGAESAGTGTATGPGAASPEAGTAAGTGPSGSGTATGTGTESAGSGTATGTGAESAGSGTAAGTESAGSGTATGTGAESAGSGTAMGTGTESAGAETGPVEAGTSADKVSVGAGADTDSAFQNATAAGEESDAESMLADEGQPFLSAVNDFAEVIVVQCDGSYFEAGTGIELLTIEDMAEELENLQVSVQEWETLLEEVWIEALIEEYAGASQETWTEETKDALKAAVKENIQVFLPFYVKVTDADGNALSGNEVMIDFQIHDEEMYQRIKDETASCYAGLHDPENDYKLSSVTGELFIGTQEEEKYVVYSLTTLDYGWYSLLQTDSSLEEELSAIASPEMSENMEEMDASETDIREEDETEAAVEETGPEAVEAETKTAETETDAGEEGSDAAEAETDEMAAEGEGETEEETDETEAEEDTALYSLEEETETLDAQIMLMAASVGDDTPSGSPVISSGSGYTLVSVDDRVYSSLYNPVKWNSSTSLSLWSTAGSDVVQKQFVNGNTYFLPVSDNAKGKFGWRYTNVAYNTTEHCYVDLYVTVTDYNNYCYDSSGNKFSPIYPVIAPNPAAVGVLFINSFPCFELKCDFVKSGTTTPVAGNYRMRWTDIDGWQRYGICMQSGTLAGKYAVNNCVLYYETKTLFGRSYLVLNAQEALGDDDIEQSAMYELKGTAGIYLAVQQPYRDTCNVRTSSYLKSKYADAVNGELDTNAKIGWTGTAYGPTEIGTPVKYVSNDGTTLASSNTLDTVTSSYYYVVEHFVPEESSSYYYSSYKITDALPAGTDYDGAWSVIQLETGKNVSSWFTTIVSNDVATFTANASAKGSSSFYGYNYRYILRVKMDPTEITPTYKDNTATYTVQNTASVTAQHITDSTATTIATNTVTTTASETKSVQAAPYKRLDSNTNLLTKVNSSIQDEIVFSVYQDIPSFGYAWQPKTVTMTDVLEDVLIFEKCEVALRLHGSTEFNGITGWGISNTGQTVIASAGYDSSYAGGTLRFDITCRIDGNADLREYYTLKNQATWAVITNTASVAVAWAQGSPEEVTQSTNEVTELFPIPEIRIELKKTNADTAENISNAEFTVYEWDGSNYTTTRGTMTYDADSAAYIMENLDRTRTNEGKYKIVETRTPNGYVGAFEQTVTVPEKGSTTVTLEAQNSMAKGTITICKKSKKGEYLSGAEYEISAAGDIVSPEGKVLAAAGTVVETVTTDEKGSAVSSGLYPGEYLVTETKAPDGYALDAEPQSVSILYKDNNTALTNVSVTFVNDRLYGYITLTKEIDAEDIVWAHGNPTFTFKVSGMDVSGEEHTYYDTVEFEPENTGSSGKAALSVTIKVPAGSYTASEEKTMRYELREIYGIVNGAAAGESVDFNMTNGGAAKATFYNVKTTDEDESHSSFVRNSINAG